MIRSQSIYSSKTDLSQNSCIQSLVRIKRRNCIYQETSDYKTYINDENEQLFIQ